MNMMTTPPIERIDERTGRPFGDHGTAVQAIQWALYENNDIAPGEGEDFLRSWFEGAAFDDGYPDFYEWLNAQ